MDALMQLRIIHQEREAYLKQLQPLYPPHGTNRLVQKAIEYIHMHFFKDTCTVQHLKDELGIHDHNFTSLFKHKMHMGIKEYYPSSFSSGKTFVEAQRIVNLSGCAGGRLFHARGVYNGV